jgi:hypothetical protein
VNVQETGEAQKAQASRHTTSLLVALGFLFAGIFLEYSAISRINSGKLTYTLDDAYIHLSLAENIIDGHYGVNSGEFSAPSSSILWPFLIAPFAKSNIGESIPLLINIAAAVATLFLFYKILDRAISVESGKTVILSVLLVLLIGVTNLLGLIFTGMEHSLQLLLSMATLWGLVIEVEDRRVSGWLTAGVIFGPLIRYENIAVSAGALLYLLLCGRWKRSLVLFATIALSVGFFSLYLMSLGLRPLPTSTFAKSMILSSGGAIASVFKHFLYSLTQPAGVLLLTGIFALLCCGLLSKSENRNTKILCVSISIMIFLHLAAGLYGWYHRYEIYIWTVTILGLIYLRRAPLSAALRRHGRRTMSVIVLFGIIVSFFYILDLRTIPLASNNIYEQHFQMHRFAVDFYRGPVAVNDVGYVSYRNPHHVLDLFGLASEEALDLRMKRADAEWMNMLANRHNVELAMIYDNTFRQLPPNWYKVGELRLGKRRITAFNSVVSFYALKAERVPRVFNLLHAFRTTLPEGATLTLLRPRL